VTQDECVGVKRKIPTQTAHVMDVSTWVATTGSSSSLSAINSPDMFFGAIRWLI
jgi:hypothetical protein